MATIYLSTMNGHRNNVSELYLLEKMFKYIGFTKFTRLKTNDHIIKSDDILILWNGTNAEVNYFNKVVKLFNRVIYLQTDCDLFKPDVNKYPNVTVLSQFLEHSDVKYLNVASLYVFHNLWDNPILKEKTKHIVYGGTYKERRDYNFLAYLLVEPSSDKESVILANSNERWLRFNNKATITPIYRDLSDFYYELAYAEYTVIVNDPEHIHNVPARYFECVLTNTKCIIQKQSDIPNDYYVVTPEEIRSEYTKDSVATHFINTFKLLGIDIPYNDPDLEQIKSNDTNEVLANRGAIYGRYSDGVKCRETIMKALNECHYRANNEQDLPGNVRVMFSDIILKMMRIASNPNVEDSWVDLEGYAKLAKEVMVDGK